MSAAPITFVAAAGGATRPRPARPPQLDPRVPATARAAGGQGAPATPARARGEIQFQFNPKELALTKSAKWKRDAAAQRRKKSGVPEFTGADPAS